MFAACLSLAQNPAEARLVAENLESLARALRDWPAEAWERVASDPNPPRDGLFQRLGSKAAPMAKQSRQRTVAIASAEETAAVLRVLWPQAGTVSVEREVPREAVAA
jgi:hypothetical protein